MPKRILLVSSLFVLLGAGCFGGKSAAGNDGGLYMSADGASSWTQSAALPGATSVGSIASADVLSLEIDPSDDTAYYLGTVANGLLFSYDSGETWARPEEELLRGGSVRSVEVDPRSVCTYYVMKSDRIAKTTTCGRTFDTESYVESRKDELLTSMVLDWYNPNTLYVTTTAGDVLRSVDAGKGWSAAYRVKDEATSFMVSNSDSRILLLGTKRHGLIRSTDSGATWTEYEDTLNKLYKNSDKVSAFSQTADGKTLLMSSAYGILVSKDAGETWSALSLIPSSGEVAITAIAVDPQNGNSMYFGTSTTMYHSVDGGVSWTTDELPSSRTASVIAVDPESSARVFLGLVSPKK